MANIFDASDKTGPGHYGPSQTALLLLDFHSLFVQKVGGPNAPDALATAVNLRNWAKSLNMPIIHGLIDTNQAPYPTCKGADRLNGVIKAMKESGGEEPEDLTKDPAHNEITFGRTPGHVSALKSPGLEDYLKKNGIKSLILTGLSTSGCVLRTAIPATDAEYIVTVISDGCADPQDGVHDTCVGKLLNNRGHVTTAKEFQEGYAKAAGGK